jgi:hypothetical protein
MTSGEPVLLDEFYMRAYVRPTLSEADALRERERIRAILREAVERCESADSRLVLEIDGD